MVNGVNLDGDGQRGPSEQELVVLPDAGGEQLAHTHDAQSDELQGAQDLEGSAHRVWVLTGLDNDIDAPGEESSQPPLKIPRRLVSIP